MSDYTKHKDVTRRARYLKRHSGMGEDWKDPTTAGALSRWILWNKPTFKASVADYKRTGEHLDRELTLRGARTSGTTQRKQQRLQRFVEAESNDTAKFEAHHQKVMARLDNRIEELRITLSASSPRVVRSQPADYDGVRRSSRIHALLGQYLGY
jgi:hypothetical protein